MADNFELDFGSFSPDYDLEYDFGGSSNQAKKPKKKGEVIKDFASGLWEGFTDGVTGYGVPQRLIKSMLPRSYGPAMDTVDRTLRFKDDLYDKVRENTKESVSEFKNLTREALSIHGAKVPAKLAARLEAWAESGTKQSSWQDYITEDDKLDVDADSTELLDAFTHGAAANAELGQAQHEELMATLAAGAVSNQKDNAKQSILLDQIAGLQRRLVGFNETYTSTFQRRSLELQFRHYKLDISIAKMQEQYYKRSLEAFAGLVVNSAKTEMEKAAKSEGHQKLIRKNYGGGALKSTFSRYGNHLYDSMYGLVDNASQNANNRWSATAGGLAAAMRAGQQAKMSGVMNGARNKGAMIGNMAASAMPFLLQQLVRNRMERSGSANGLGHNLSYYAESAPGLVNGWLRNRKQFDEHYNEFDPNNKWYTRLQKGVLNPLMNNALFNIPITQGNKTRVTTPGIKDLTQPAQWDMMSRRTLVEVIPGLLTQQLSVQQRLLASWSGEKAPQEQAFNHKQGAFTTKARVKADIRSSIFNRNEFQSAAGSFNGMVETLDPDEELSANARVALAMRFARDADAGDGFNINNYLSDSGWVNAEPGTIKEINEFLHKRFDTKEATGHAKAFGKYQIGDSADVAELRKKVATNMQSQMNYMPDVQESVNALANGGQRAMLKEMGIIQRVNGQEIFNHDMYWDMMKKFISNPNYRPDMDDGEDGEKKRDITDRMDTGAIDELKNKAKDRIKASMDDLGVTDVTDKAKGRVNDLLGRGKDAVTESTRRLRETMTKEALNKLFDDAFDKYDTLVAQLQRLARTGSELDIRSGIAEVKQRAEQAIKHIRKQLADLDKDALGEDAYNAAKARAEEVIAALMKQIDTLDISSLRSGIEAGPAVPPPDLADTQVLGGESTRERVLNPQANQTPVPEEPSPELAVASETNQLLKELIAVSASARDQISAAKDATIAQITGDPAALNAGIEERKGFLKSLGGRMKSFEGGKIAKMVGMGRLYSSGVLTLTKWATVGPALLGFKAAKTLWKFLRKKKDGTLGDTDGDGIRENSWMDRFRKKKEKGEQKVDKDGKPKEEPKSIFGLLSGIWGAVTGLVGGISKFGILGGLANFLKLGWLKTLGAGLVGLLKGKEAATTGADLLDQAGELFGGDDEDGDDQGSGRDRDRRGRGRRDRRAAARERLDRMRNRNQPRGGLLKRSAKWLAKNTVGRAARAITRAPAGMAGRASWLLRGGASTLAKKIPVVGSLGMGAFEMYQSYADNDGQGMAEAAGGGIGGALGGAAMGAAVGSVVPVVGTFLGGVVGAAVGAMGGSALGASLYKWIKSPGLLQQMRLYQYGLNSINGDYTGKILALEQACLKYVKVTDSGKAMLDPKLPLAELARPFIENPDSRDEVESFGGWFVQRFKPVFLTHVAVAKQLLPSSDFMSLDDSKDNAAKYEMAKRCQEFDPVIDHPYRWTGMLFNTQPAMDQQQTTAAVQDIVTRLKAQVKDTDNSVKSTSVVMTGNEERSRNQAMDKGVVDAIKPVGGGKLKGVNLEGHLVSTGLGSESVVVSVEDVLGKILPKKGEPLDDLTAARMKIYGLPNLDINRISVLLQLELVMQNRITFTGRGVQFSGKTKEVFDVMAGSFGHGWMSFGAFKSWSKWFSRRFLPAYLSFASTVKNQAGDDKPTMTAMGLPPETKLAIINGMTSQTYNDGRSDLSIWTVSDNPFNDSLTINTDATILDAHLNSLKQLAKQAQYETRPVKGGIQQDGTTDKDWRRDSKTGLQTTNAVKGTDGLVRSSQQQETVYDPKTGQTTASYGGNAMGGSQGAAASGSGGGLDTTGKVEPLKMGPGTEEGVRAMIREAAKNGITDKKELAIMLANTHHETGGFKQVEENLRYKPQTLMKLWPHRFPTMESASAVAGGGPVAIANSIYGKRMGNNEPGDGWKYRGRGFIQLTGKENYTRASKALGVDLVDDPDQVAEDPTMAAASALYFWKANKNIGAKAKAGDVAGVRKIVNGGTIGLEDTQKLAAQYSKMLDGGEYDDILSGKDKGDAGSTSDGGQSMEEMMGQSAKEQAEQQGEAPKPQPGSENASASTPPPGSTTNAAPGAGQVATPPVMQSTTGPGATATENATSVTPNAPDSAASADADALNKSSMQTQQSAPSASSTVNPVPVTIDDTHSKTTAQNTATTNEKLDQMIEALNLIAGTNKAMAEKEVATPPTAPATAVPQQQSAPQASRSNPVGMGNPNIALQRNY